MSEEPGTDPQHPLDSAAGWVARDIAAYVATDGKEGSDHHGAPLLLLTTRGSKSGQWRRTALIYGESEGRYVIVASKGGAPRHPSWYFNLVADPGVWVQVGARTFPATAKTADAEEKRRLWPMMVGIWPDYANYAKMTDREIPVVILEPVPTGA
jgi:deazaflavin-dependent oxidoreductase (nitroreductase family)